MIKFKQRLLNGTAMNFVAVAFNQGSTLLANVIVARILLKQGFGEYAFVQATLLTIATLSQLATGYTASKYIAEFRSTDPVRAGRIMGMCALVSVLMAGVSTLLFIGLAPWLANVMFNTPHLVSALIFGAGFLFFSAVNGYQIGVLSGVEEFTSLAKAGAASGIITIVTISMGALWGGLNGAVIGLSVSALCRCCIHYVFIRIAIRKHSIVPQYRGSLKSERAIIFKFALPSALSGYITPPILLLANTLLIRQAGGYDQMALYASSTSLRMLVLFIPNVINKVSMAIMNNLKGKGEDNQYNCVYQYSVVVVVLVILICGCVIGFFGGEVLSVFGKDFSAGKSILQILMAATLFEGVSVVLYQHLQVQEKIWLSFFAISIPREIVFICLAFLLVPEKGALGLSVAYTVAWFWSLCTITLLVYKDNLVGRSCSRKHYMCSNQGV